MADLLNTFRAFQIGNDPFFNILSTIERQDTFPAYNIVQLNETDYIVELALAGYTKEDVEITVKDKVLSIFADKKDKNYGEEFIVKLKDNWQVKYPQVIHSGISYRRFTKTFTLGQNTEITNATFEDGLLIISLTQKIPEEKKTKTIRIK